MSRETRETGIELRLGLDGSGQADVATGIGFLDHLLTLLAHHGRLDLRVRARGDLEVDYHHTVEDVGLVLGQALGEALGDRAGIRRYGFFYAPMDESLARVVLDLGGRPFLVWDVSCPDHYIRDFNLLLVREFLRGVADRARANLHVRLEYGDEPHHVAEAIVKAFARALAVAVEIDPRLGGATPSSKGVV